jgi:release factor glutamine methyltransferase
VTVLEVIRKSTDYLAKRGVESARLQTELLLADVLRMPRMRLYLEFEREIPEPQLETLRELVRRRGRREPLQHLVRSVSFCGLELKATRAALIPRPETELLAEKAWVWVQARRDSGDDTSTVRVLDFGTGSGCIACAVAVRVPEVEVHALDCSTQALELARENAHQLGLGERIRLHHGEGLAALPDGLTFDLIVSNPPYIPSAEIDQLEPEVRDHDPRLALDGGEDGLKWFRHLAQSGRQRVVGGGGLIVEFGAGQEAVLPDLFAGENWIVEEISPDYTARPRFLAARLPEGGGGGNGD